MNDEERNVFALKNYDQTKIKPRKANNETDKGS